MQACSPEWQERLSAWFDGECDAGERTVVERHLSGCGRCARELERYGSLRTALRAQGAAEAEVPSALRERVSALARPAPRPAFRRRRVWASFAASLAAAGVLWTAWPNGLSEGFAMDLERHHLKAFSRKSPCEFESSDPAAVKAWVKREVGYDVEVPVVPGATLLGARRCRLHGQVTASLLYRHGDGALTLFVPAAGSPAEREAARFAEEGARCTQGPVGERICVAPGSGGAHAAVAVSELEPAVLLGALGGLSR